MRVLVAGASGVIGRQLVVLLTAAGHEVIGTARSEGSSASATVKAVDALDRGAVVRAVKDAAPDAIVNMLTAIPARIDPKRLAQDFAMTNRLRTEGTKNLLHAAERSGVRRVVAQGLAYGYDPHGPGLADEETPLWLDPPKPFAPVLAALTQLEEATLRADGAVLRFGHLYGPGTSYAPDGSFVQQVRERQLPLVGGGKSVFSFTHTYDAAAAVVAVLATGHSGVFNVVDDEPAPMSQWLPLLAREVGAPEPRKVPVFLARWAVGPWGIAFMTQLRGADNSRARRVLGWQPTFTSWRTSFPTELHGAAVGQLPGVGGEVGG